MIKRVLALAVLITLLTPFLFTGAPVYAASLGVSPQSGSPGTTFVMTGGGFGAGEQLALWIGGPDGQTRGQGNIAADGNGDFTFKVSSSDLIYGRYQQVVHGLSSGREVWAFFDVTNPYSANKASGSGPQAVIYAARGFGPRERIAVWANFADGSVRAFPYASADDKGYVKFTVQPRPEYPRGDFTMVGHGLSTGIEIVRTLNFERPNSADIATQEGEVQAAAGGGAQAAGQVFAPRNIVNPQGPAVYLNTQRDELWYFPCSWKWRSMGRTVYMMALGFKPGEQVKVSYQILDIGFTAFVTNLNADGRGNVSFTYTGTDPRTGHYHWLFQAASRTLCGHYDLPN